MWFNQDIYDFCYKRNNSLPSHSHDMSNAHASLLWWHITKYVQKTLLILIWQSYSWIAVFFHQSKEWSLVSQMGSISEPWAHAKTTAGTSKFSQNTKGSFPSDLHCKTEICLLLTVGRVFFLYSTRTKGIHSVTLLGANEEYGKLRAEEDLHGALSMELRLLGYQLGICAFTDVCVKKWCKPIISFGHIFHWKNEYSILQKEGKESVSRKLRKKITWVKMFYFSIFKCNVWLFNSIWCLTAKLESMPSCHTKMLLIRKL